MQIIYFTFQAAKTTAWAGAAIHLRGEFGLRTPLPSQQNVFKGQEKIVEKGRPAVLVFVARAEISVVQPVIHGRQVLHQLAQLGLVVFCHRYSKPSSRLKLSARGLSKSAGFPARSLHPLP